MGVLEVGCMGVKPGKDVMNEATEEGQILLDTWKTVLSNPTGPDRIHHGLEIEDPSLFWGFMEWESIEAHETFAKKFGGEAVKNLPLIFSHGEFTKHFVTDPYPPVVLQAPVTQMIIAYLPSDAELSAKERVSKLMRDLLTANLHNTAEQASITCGWGVENDFPVRDSKGQKASICVALVGWQSIEAQKQHEKTQEYRQLVEYLSNAEEVVQVLSVNMECQTLSSSSK